MVSFRRSFSRQFQYFIRRDYGALFDEGPLFYVWEISNAKEKNHIIYPYFREKFNNFMCSETDNFFAVNRYNWKETNQTAWRVDSILPSLKIFPI